MRAPIQNSGQNITGLMGNIFPCKLSGRNFNIEEYHLFLRCLQGVTVPLPLPNRSRLYFLILPSTFQLCTSITRHLSKCLILAMSGCTHFPKEGMVRTAQHHCCRDNLQVHSVMRIAAVRLSAHLEGWFPVFGHLWCLYMSQMVQDDLKRK